MPQATGSMPQQSHHYDNPSFDHDLEKTGSSDGEAERRAFQRNSNLRTSDGLVSSNGSYLRSEISPPKTSFDLDLPTERQQNEGAEEEEGFARDQWTNPLEFLMSCISMAVGLGNVWRFPITAYNNGGGAFLLPYIIVLVFVGRPMYFMEMCLGQFCSSGCVGCWSAVPALKGIGFAQMTAICSIMSYYTALMALNVFYFVQSFQAVLPWAECDPTWESEQVSCVGITGNYTLDSNSSQNFQSSTELFYTRFVLNQPQDLSRGPGLPDWRLVLCLLFSWVAILFSQIKGVKSSGKVAYFTAIFPYLVLLGLLVQVFFLEGSTEGILFFLTPQWEKLLEPSVWYAAVTQSFFSLGAALGTVLTYSSFNAFRQNIYRDSIIISVIDTMTSFLAGVITFGILGYLKNEVKAESISSVVQGGTGLAFITYPTAIARFGYGNQAFAALFFLMMFTLGIGSANGQAGAIINLVLDQLHLTGLKKRRIVTVLVCAGAFTVGTVYVTPGGTWLIDLVDFYGGGFIIYVIAISETVGISWIYGVRRFITDMDFMLQHRLGIYWLFCWALMIPVGLSAILIYSFSDFKLPRYQQRPFPTIAYVVGWLLAATALGWIPLCILYKMYTCEESTLRMRIKRIFAASSKWGPQRTTDKKEWEAFKVSKGY